MKKNIILISVLLSSLNIAQKLNIKTPQSYEIERYGNIPVNLNVGGLDLNIPLFEENFPSIGDLKMTLNYNSSGFLPAKKSNYVGHDWFLNFGGVISRDINGVADESMTSTNSPRGFLAGVRMEPKTNTKIYEGDFYAPFAKENIKIEPYSYELIPDKFNFNFMGISGYFYIGNDGKPIASSNDMNLKIDISNLSNQDNFRCTPEDSEIVITDGKGIKYYFGGHYNNLEIAYQMGTSNTPSQELPNDTGIFSINSWYLRKIQYPSKGTLEINYLDYTSYGLGNFCLSIPPPVPGARIFGESFFDYNKYINQEQNRFKYSYNTSMGGYYIWGDGSGFNYESPYLIYTLTKKVFPAKILVNGQEIIKFNYNEFASQTNNYKSYKLKNIEIKNGNNIVRTVGFDYYQNKDRFFLTALNFSGNKKYTFDYYSKENLPRDTTLGVDFWGYWNGLNENSNYLIPTYQFDATTGDYQIIGKTRNPNPDLVSTALLKNITYPTGGNSSFYYEPHQYSKKVEKDFSSQFLPYIKNESGQVGGARISKIVDFDGTNSLVRDFKYIKNYGSGSTESSGIATQTLRYMSFTDEKNQLSGRYQTLRETATNIAENSMSSSPIAYSEVAELRNNILQKKYFFSDYNTNPDALLERTIVHPVLTDDVKPYLLLKNFYVKHNSNDYQRGKLLKLQLYKEGNIIQETENNYTTLNSHPVLQNKFFSRVHITSPWIRYQKEYVYPYFLNSTSVKDYINGKIVTTKTDYFYEGTDHLNLTKTKSIYATGDYTENKFQYASDIRLGNTPNIQYPGFSFVMPMLYNNAAGLPIVTTAYKNGIFIKKNVTQYNDMILPYKDLSYFEDKIIVGSPNVPDINFGTEEIVYNTYDNYGNVVQYTTKDGVPTVIVWGYNHHLPIAKIEGKNATYFLSSLDTDIVSLSNNSDTDIDSSTEELFREKLDAFQSRQFDFDVSITTYTHNPLVGITSITPPSGIREVYIYDTANRLKEIRQDSATGKLLKTFKYNYKN